MIVNVYLNLIRILDYWIDYVINYITNYLDKLDLASNFFRNFNCFHIFNFCLERRVDMNPINLVSLQKIVKIPQKFREIPKELFK